MLQLAKTISGNLGKTENELRELVQVPALFLRRKVAFVLWQNQLLTVADYRQLLPEQLQGEGFSLNDGCYAMLSPMNGRTIAVLQAVLEPLVPRLPQKPLKNGSFAEGFTPLFQAETQDEYEQVVASVFNRGWQQGFAVTSSVLSGSGIMPLLVPESADLQPDERQREDYCGRTFVLSEGHLIFGAERLACCVRQYGKVLHLLKHCRKRSVLALPDDVLPEDLLFINRELWLAKSKFPVFLLPQNVYKEMFTAVNNTYGKAELC